MSTLPPEILWKVINGLVYVLGALISIGISVFVFFHKSILRRLDSIDTDLKPIATQIAVQKERTDTLHERLNEHERRISKLEGK
jgi:septal ring factor EnvC (AmiA/AmiB activator)